MKNVQVLTLNELVSLDGGSVDSYYIDPLMPSSGEPSGRPYYPNLPIF